MNSPKALTPLIVDCWGNVDYQIALKRQEQLVADYLSGEMQADRIVLVEHPATITLGRRGSSQDLLFPEAFYKQQGITLQQVKRGGLATAHEPGQLVAYPILRLKQNNIKWFAHSFLSVIVRLLADYNVEGYLKDGEPGVWVGGAKICSFGIGLKKWVSYHGIALNVNNDLNTFKMIVPCGRPGEVVTSLSQQLGHQVVMDELYGRFLGHFCTVFDYSQVSQ